MAFPNVSDIIATTIEERSGEFADNITNNTAALIKMQEKGNIQTFSGGRLIYEELAYGTNSNGAWYSGYETLTTGAQELLSAAEFNIKQYAVPVTVSGLELIQNNGRNGVIDLLESRIKASRATMKNDLETSLYSDGTAALGKELVGFKLMVAASPSTGTYGGINRANFSFWRNQTNTVTITASNAQSEMTELWASCTRGNDQPNLILAGNTVWPLFMASLQANQRFTDPKLADAGFANAFFMSAPVVLGGGIGNPQTLATDFLFLNTNYIKFRPVAGRNMTALKKREAFNQDAEVVHLVWAGALTCNGAKFQGRLVGA